MTSRERVSAALAHIPLTGRVPLYEFIFSLTMTAYGSVHHDHRRHATWAQMKASERELHGNDMENCVIKHSDCNYFSAKGKSLFSRQSRNPVSLKLQGIVA